MKTFVSYSEFKEKIKNYRRHPALKGGLSKGMKPIDFNPKSLYKGYKVELEHTGTFNVAVTIAMDHLVESKDYYKYLEKMEKEMKRNEKK